MMLGDEDNMQRRQLQGLMGCKAISVHQTTGILWFWCLLMVIFSTMMQEVLIVVELCNMPYHAAVCCSHASASSTHPVVRFNY